MRVESAPAMYTMLASYGAYGAMAIGTRLVYTLTERHVLVSLLSLVGTELNQHRSVVSLCHL